MSARIPHLLTKLLTESEADALRAEMLERASASKGDVCRTWLDAVMLLEKHVNASFERRSKQTPSARRKSLSYRPTAITH